MISSSIEEDYNTTKACKGHAKKEGKQFSQEGQVYFSNYINSVFYSTKLSGSHIQYFISTESTQKLKQHLDISDKNLNSP